MNRTGLYDMCACIAYTWRLGNSYTLGEDQDLCFSMSIAKIRRNEIYCITGFMVVTRQVYDTLNPYSHHSYPLQ